MCDTSICPDQGTTSGSQSSPTNFNERNLALAAATAREALVTMAAKKFRIAPEELTAVNGMVIGKQGGRVSYGELIGDRQFDLPLNPAAKRKPQSEWTVMGKPVPGLQNPQLMTGHFEFVQYVSVPDMLHGRVVRPPAMGATLIRADESSVRDVPGVVKVVVLRDFVGVVAQTQYAAIQAARKLRVEWKPGPQLPDHATYFDYLQKQPSRDSASVDSGDVVSQLKAAEISVRARYTYPHQMHGSLGSSCAVADVRKDSATIWSSTQSAYPTRSVAAKILGLPLEKVRVIFTRGSGCYGLNGADAVSFDAAVLSQEAGKPVRLQYSRQDEMMWENLGAAMVIEHHAGLSADGSILAWDRKDWAADRGGRPGYEQPGNVISGVLLGFETPPLKPGPATPPSGELRNQSNTVPEYFSGCIDGRCGGSGMIRSERALTHTVWSPFFTGPLRSPRRIQNTFANECFMDELAAQVKADPVEYRLKHLKNERVRDVLNAAAEAAKWLPGPHAMRALPATGKVSGRGVACVAYEGGNGYAAVVADVDVDVESGVVAPRHFFCAIDVGPISNPDGLKNQAEGGLLQGMSRALGEQVTWNTTHITSTDWSTYHSLYLDYDVPGITAVLLNRADVPATGAGETTITLTPAAIGNAVFDATGVRLRNVPFTAERVKQAMREAGVANQGARA
jgi:CO/xanthine dehydrogenase Mo-binding subunit